MRGSHIVWGLLRLSLGWVFFWAFIDKLIGLGFVTCRDAETGAVMSLCEKAWLAGGSPTFGFLTFGTHGPLAGFYQSLAGNVVVDWLFMLGLLGIGMALLLGVLTRVAAWSGIVLLLLMYTAAMPPANNPVMDDHLVYALLLLALTFVPVGDWLGFGQRWKRQAVVQRHRWLQ